MKKFVLLLVSLIIFSTALRAQDRKEKLRRSIAQFGKDMQLRHAAYSLYVIDAKTGAVLCDKDGEIGLAPASTQKVITSITAYELLGADYRFTTELGYTGRMSDGVVDGDLLIMGSGDPTLGSWRWPATQDTSVLERWAAAVRQAGIRSVTGSIVAVGEHFEGSAIPDGWIWQDIGNYYGAGAFAVNWRENQFPVKLRSGAVVGTPVTLLEGIDTATTVNEVKAAAAGTGDNTYVYYDGSIRGTIPVNQPAFEISAAMVDPASALVISLKQGLTKANVEVQDRVPFLPAGRGQVQTGSVHQLYSGQSPSLDSIVYWLNKKSINLYAEALLKSIAMKQTGVASTSRGVEAIQSFWTKIGIDATELNISDGSGLSPQNRITTHAQVSVLNYARTRSWFDGFYRSLPVFNDMVMKSGTIADVKGFCGYQRSADGHDYIFSFLVNNYSGPASALIPKMYRVLDVLK